METAENPRRIVTILEESLVNDATALVLYRAAVGAAMSGSFALGHTLFEFVFAALVGVVIGIGVAWLTRWALCATDDGFTQIGVTLLAPYIAWVCGSRCMPLRSWLVWRVGCTFVSRSAARCPRLPDCRRVRCGIS